MSFPSAFPFHTHKPERLIELANVIRNDYVLGPLDKEDLQSILLVLVNMAAKAAQASAARDADVGHAGEEAEKQP